MLPQDMKAKATRFVEEVINTGKLDRFTEFYATDYVDHVSRPPDFPTGFEGWKLFFGGLRAAFPDFHAVVEDTIVEGGKIVLRVTAHGTMKGSFLGMPATGKHASWGEIHIIRRAGDKFVEHWAILDQLGMLQQLGLAPTSGKPN